MKFLHQFRQRGLGLVLLCLCGLLWGTVPSLSKIATTVDGHPVGLALVQNCIGACVCLGICFLRGTLQWPSRSELLFYLRWAVLYSVVNQVLVYWLAMHIDAAFVSIAIVFEGVVVAAFAVVLKLESLSLSRCLGLVLGLAGVLLLLLSHTALSTRGSLVMMLVALLVPVSYAAEDIYVAARKPIAFDPVLAVALVMACSVPMLAALALATHDFMPLQWPPGRSEVAACAIVAVSLCAYLSFLALLSWAGPIYAGQVGYATTLGGLGWSTWLLGETVSWDMLGAVALVICGLSLAKPREIPVAVT